MWKVIPALFHLLRINLIFIHSFFHTHFQDLFIPSFLSFIYSTSILILNLLHTQRHQPTGQHAKTQTQTHIPLYCSFNILSFFLSSPPSSPSLPISLTNPSLYHHTICTPLIHTIYPYIRLNALAKVSNLGYLNCIWPKIPRVCTRSDLEEGKYLKRKEKEKEKAKQDKTQKRDE